MSEYERGLTDALRVAEEYSKLGNVYARQSGRAVARRIAALFPKPAPEPEPQQEQMNV